MDDPICTASIAAAPYYFIIFIEENVPLKGTQRVTLFDAGPAHPMGRLRERSNGL